MLKIAFYQPDIAGNIGTMIRTSACLGVEMHIIEPCGFVFDVKKMQRAALDYADFCTIIRHNSFEEFLEKIQQQKSRLVLFTTKSAANYTDFIFQENDILLFGRESAGVPEEVAQKADARIKIMMKNNSRSLNVAISAAMALGEALRQTYGK